jgi:hypothetical protein
MEVGGCRRFTHNSAMVARPCFLHKQGFFHALGRTRDFLSRPFIDRSDLVTTLSDMESKPKHTIHFVSRKN